MSETSVDNNNFLFEYPIKDIKLSFHKPIFYWKLQESNSAPKIKQEKKDADSASEIIKKQIVLLKNTQKDYNKENLQSKLTNCIDFDMVDS